MSLQAALNTAQSIFSNTGTQMSVVSKNIANASNDTYTRRSADLVAADYGAVITGISRSEDFVLQKANLSAISDLSAQQTLYDGLAEVTAALGGNEYATSPATYLSKFRDSMQSYAALPSDTTLAQTVISDAIDVANSLNTVSDAVQTARTEIDTRIELAVDDLNTLLSDFEEINEIIKSGTATGKDVNDELDARDGLLKDISEYISIQTMTRSNEDMVIYTTGGSVLFETSAREVSFDALNGYDATSTGNSIYVDDVAVVAGTGGNTTSQGSLQAYLQLRDDLLPTFQSQLDEIASGLVTMFDEGTGDGLFDWSQPTSSSATTITSGTIYPGLAATITVDDAYNTTAGGDATRLRDGYYTVSNTDGNTGYTDLIEGYIDQLDTDWTWDSDTELNTSLTILEFASASLGWIEEYRSEASEAVETKEATQSRTAEALSNEVGVSLDEELSLLLDLEQSYKAASQLVTTVDDMIQALLNAAG